MVGGGYQRLRRTVAVAGMVVCAAVLLTASPTGGTAARPALRVLQLNLCDSGIADCYTGRSVAAAATVLRGTAPDVVTLNEVCEPDVATLATALARPGAATGVGSAFQPALDRRSGGPFRCRNGERYGIGLLVRLPGHGSTTYQGIYPEQDTADPEERAWLCLSAPVGISVCTTHLASTVPAVALRQCGYLLDTAIPALPAGVGHRTVVIGGDFNLREGGAPDLATCAPPGYLRAGDGGVQHVLASPGFVLGSVRDLDLGGSTDHPGLLVALTSR